MIGRIKTFFDSIAGKLKKSSPGKAGEDVEVKNVSLDSSLPETGAKVLTFFRENPLKTGIITGAVLIFLAVIFGYWLYNRIHAFDEYQILGSVEENDVEGTAYAMLGSRVIKYSHDGVSCVDTQNEVQWSAAYSMQTPIYEISGSSMVIAEQQGEQVYVVKPDGVQGSFRTRFPVLQAHVSETGVAALVLEDGDVTWINLYDASGNEIASVKTTTADFGYPVDVALTPNAKQMMVSYVTVQEGEICGVLSFYDFSKASGTDESHMMGSVSYAGSVFPDVFYASSSTPVAVCDDGFVVFTGDKNPREKQRVAFENEIVSVFHDEDNIGFIFESMDMAEKYDMVVYNYNGRNTMETGFDFNYSGVRMENGEILLYNASNLYVCRTSGRLKLRVSYEKEVKYFTQLSGQRRYLVVTGNSMDRIRIC